MSKEKKETRELKLIRKHSRKKYKLGKHVITPKFQSFELNEEEVKLLETQEYKHWVGGKSDKKVVNKK